MKKRFEIIGNEGKMLNGVNNSMSRILCPDCKQTFGLSNDYLDRVGDANVHYVCPYCSVDRGLNK